MSMTPRFRTVHQQRIDLFMRCAQQEVPEAPAMPSAPVRNLRANLILEEALETIAGLGYAVVQDENTGKLTIVPFGEPNMVEVVDGCADLSVVTIGTLSAFGVSDVSVLEEVDNANLRKFGPGSFRRGDGKWIKPPDFVPPNIERVLSLQTLGTV